MSKFLLPVFYLYSFFLLCKLFFFSIFIKNGSSCAAFHIVWLVISLASFLQSHLVNFLHMSWKIILPCTSISTSWTLERSPPVMCSQVQIQSKPLKRTIKHIQQFSSDLVWNCLAHVAWGHGNLNIPAWVFSHLYISSFHLWPLPHTGQIYSRSPG